MRTWAHKQLFEMTLNRLYLERDTYRLKAMRNPVFNANVRACTAKIEAVLNEPVAFEQGRKVAL